MEAKLDEALASSYPHLIVNGWFVVVKLDQAAKATGFYTSEVVRQARPDLCVNILQECSSLHPLYP
jgi:hypothetical protein